MRSAILVGFALLLAAPVAQAQTQTTQGDFLDCSGGCTEWKYGFGDDPVPPGGNTTDRSVLEDSVLYGGGQGRDGGPCGFSRWFPVYGQMVIRDRNDCETTSTNRCVVEIPDRALESGHFASTKLSIPLGALGVVNLAGATILDYTGNLGYRQLLGSCTNDAGEECGVDADCPSNSGCMSTCFSDPGVQCASHADCPNQTRPDCVTELDFDGIGYCSDTAADGIDVCTRGSCSGDASVPCGDDAVCALSGNGTCIQDTACPSGETCFDAFELINAEEGCFCCDSTGNNICGPSGFVEYPDVACPIASPSPFRRDAADYTFKGGRGTDFDAQPFTVPGQSEGHCVMNSARSCGQDSSLFEGADAGKCASGLSGNQCSVSGDPCTTDADCTGLNEECGCPDPFSPDNPSLPSECNDVAFGGITGDFCDFSEAGFRNFSDQQVSLIDGRPNPRHCTTSLMEIHAKLGSECRVPFDIPDGDPLPGCQLANVGVEGRADVDCNGVDDLIQGVCADRVTFCSTDADCPDQVDPSDPLKQCLTSGDLCPFIVEFNPYDDTNDDTRGDDCQCGDANGDGAITGLDIGGMALCANGVGFCDASLIDADGDQASTATDIGGIVAAVTGTISTLDLECQQSGAGVPIP